MTEKYYGDAKTRAQGGSIVLTIPAAAVHDLDIDAGDHIPIYRDGDVLKLASMPSTEQGDDDDEQLP